jgi:hypothetical protein
MSYGLIRAALEARLDAMSPALPTSWENIKFDQTVGIASQRINLLPGQTENPTFGDNAHLEVGIFQVSLCYPIGNGVKDAIDRAELVRAQFPRGQSMTSGSVTVRVSGTPSIAPALTDSGFYVVPVSIPYFAYI